MFKVTNPEQTSAPKYYLRIKEEGKETFLIMFDGYTTWTGTLDLSKKERDLAASIKKALTTYNSAYIYVNDHKNQKFYLKTRFHGTMGYTTIIEVPLTMEPNFDIEEIEYLLSKTSQLDSLQKQLKELSQQRDNAIEEARNVIEEKNNLRETLGKQFVQILNEKKEKIVRLEAQIKHLEEQSVKKKHSNTLEALDDD